MLPSELTSIDLRFESGRPAHASLRLTCGLELSGFRIWRTPNGPRVVFPVLPPPDRRPVFRISRALKREWELAIVDAWRAQTRDFVGRPDRLRRAA
jgi:hypothetical protein